MSYLISLLTPCLLTFKHVLTPLFVSCIFLKVRAWNLWSWGCGFELQPGHHHVVPLDKVLNLTCFTWHKWEWGAVEECHNLRADRLSATWPVAAHLVRWDDSNDFLITNNIITSRTRILTMHKICTRWILSDPYIEVKGQMMIKLMWHVWSYPVVILTKTSKDRSMYVAMVANLLLG